MAHFKVLSQHSTMKVKLVNLSGQPETLLGFEPGTFWNTSQERNCYTNLLIHILELLYRVCLHWWIQPQKHHFGTFYSAPYCTSGHSLQNIQSLKSQVNGETNQTGHYKIQHTLNLTHPSPETKSDNQLLSCSIDTSFALIPVVLCSLYKVSMNTREL